jgi:hypothetical protein
LKVSHDLAGISFMKCIFSVVVAMTAFASAQQSIYRDPSPQHYKFQARASEIDSRAKAHPEIDFVFEKGGKPADLQFAAVDTRVAPQGKLVIWLMGHNGALFDKLSSYGFHSIQVHYANGWFGKLYGNKPPEDDLFLSKVRLEAATGKDFSKAVDIPEPDGMMERALQFVKWLDKKNPQARWDGFLTPDRKSLRWDRVIVSGASHGSTTAARFAKHQRVSRVVMFSGPRDQYEVWQKLPSATPENCYFGFTHTLDDGWKNDHYCRSWELLGLAKFGAVTDVDQAKSPYGHSRRLITSANVGNNPGRAHSASVPGGAAVKDKKGAYIHEDVWRYLFTHPVDEVGQPDEHDESCTIDQRALLK